MSQKFMVFSVNGTLVFVHLKNEFVVQAGEYPLREHAGGQDVGVTAPGLLGQLVGPLDQLFAQAFAPGAPRHADVVAEVDGVALFGLFVVEHVRLARRHNIKDLWIKKIVLYF